MNYHIKERIVFEIINMIELAKRYNSYTEYKPILKIFCDSHNNVKDVSQISSFLIGSENITSRIVGSKDAEIKTEQFTLTIRNGGVNSRGHKADALLVLDFGAHQTSLYSDVYMPIVSMSKLGNYIKILN